MITVKFLKMPWSERYEIFGEPVLALGASPKGTKWALAEAEACLSLSIRQAGSRQIRV